MNYKAHMSGGILTAAGITALLYPFGLVGNLQWLLGIPLCVLYSVLPDLDHPNSKIRNYFEILVLVIVICSGLVSEYSSLLTPKQGAILGLGGAVFLLGLWFLRHRGVLHSVSFGFIISVPLLVIDLVYLIYAFSGFLSHIVLDEV